MTVIEVILPDGSIHAHLTDEREAVAIAQEVRQRYPQASYWRIGRGWHQAGVARRRTMSLDIWPRVAALAAVLALALAVAFLPPIRQTLLGAGGLTSVDLAPEADTSVPAPAEGPKEEGVTGGTTAVLDGVTPDEPALASQDIVIVSVAEQVSDTSRTLLVRLHNTGSQVHAGIKLQADFYDGQGQPVAGEQIGESVTLAPGETGSVKVWAQSRNGIERYELVILD
ncbi:MAG: hypothetical protein QM346_13225 [Chloroflexota bacterium]|nr:hypothetical protein [Chloroflexota bacterium]